MKKLSIITVNRNNANGLRQTLASAAEQTFKDFEHIVIDGASTDNSVDVIKEFSHISYYTSEPDNGIFDAMNKGIKQAKGEYCLFLNSGDYLTAPTVISEMLANFDNEDIVYGDEIWKYKDGKTLPKKKPSELSIDFFVIGSLPHQSTFIKTELLVKLNGYRTDLQIVSDWAFSIEAIFKHSASYKHIPVFVSIFILGGICSDPSNRILKLKEQEKVWKDLFPDIYKIFLRLRELDAELKKVYKIPGVKFLMEYIYPLYKKMRINAIRG
jgi:glycosyltransferase involved in cell wall biosynthesis